MALFGKRASELEYKNRLLMEVDKKRIERLEGLEVRINELLAERDKAVAERNQALAALEGQEIGVVKLEPPPSAIDTTTITAERDFYKNRVKEMEDFNNTLTDAATRYSLWAQELDRLLGQAALKETERRNSWATHVEILGVVYRTHKPD